MSAVPNPNLAPPPVPTPAPAPEPAKADVWHWALAGVSGLLFVAVVFLLFHGPLTPPAPVPPVPPAPDISLPAKLTIKPGTMAELKAATKGTIVKWIAAPGLQTLPGKDACCVHLVAATPGTYTLHAYTAVGGTPTDAAVCVVTVGLPPPPVPPVPPDPPVPPTPPTPPAPIPAAGLHVLILYDPTKLASLPKEQELILYAADVRSYLNSKCPVGDDGKTHEWRIWPDGVDASAESKLWQDAAKRAHSSTPWIIVSDGKKGFEGPLPGNVADTLALLQKFGG